MIFPEEERDFLRLQENFLDKVDVNFRVWFSEKQKDSIFISELRCVWLGSQFAFDWCCRQPRWLQMSFDCQPTDKNLSLELEGLLSGADSEDALMRVLRLFRQRCMLQIIWRDITRRAATLETTAALTALADVCVRYAVNFLYPRLCVELGTPCDESGEPQSLLILGMGKLGAFE